MAVLNAGVIYSFSLFSPPPGNLQLQPLLQLVSSNAVLINGQAYEDAAGYKISDK